MPHHRYIIRAADFVSEHGIKTVFGNGGFDPDGTLIVCIVFTRETLARWDVERVASLIGMVKGETFGFVRGRKLFGELVGDCVPPPRSAELRADTPSAPRAKRARGPLPRNKTATT